MCGIVGAVAERNVADILLAGLKRLEYRGYDSAGMALIDENNLISRRRRQGKVCQLEASLSESPIVGKVGIAHTRWATHGKPSEENAHPQTASNRIAVVHNGIIENFFELKLKLQEKGVHFQSETDTEVIAHLLDEALKTGCDLYQATRQTVKALKGLYAIAIISEKFPNQIVVARQGSPLVVGLGIGEHFVASDCLALLPVTQNFIYLEEGDIAVLGRERCDIYDAAGQRVERATQELAVSQETTEKGAYRYYMQKEIFEQPRAVLKTAEGRITAERVIPEIFGVGATEIFKNVRAVQIVACGTSYHAGLVARHWLERLVKLPTRVEIASEYRYREPLVADGTLYVTLSQSGETADTLAALRLAKKLGYLGMLSICNVPGSSLVRESDFVLMTQAGPEIGVASTKAFTSQLTALLLLTASLLEAKQTSGSLPWLSRLAHVPPAIEKVLELDKTIERLAATLVDSQSILFLGRGILYPVAMEGALKLKEISYIHAESYPAGELKHGPLALVDKNMPVIVLASQGVLLDKLKANIEEVAARGGRLIVFAEQGCDIEKSNVLEVIKVPHVHEVLTPLIATVPLQMLAYHVAVMKGTDVDQPRNLAKSVTVE